MDKRGGRGSNRGEYRGGRGRGDRGRGRGRGGYQEEVAPPKSVVITKKIEMNADDWMAMFSG